VVEIGIFIPQMGFSFPELLDRAHLLERLGYDSMWLYDHLYGPELPRLPSLEAFTLATALLARTERLRVGHLVLCNNFRHPALLGRMVSSLDVISGGRLDIGLGSGSVEREHIEGGFEWGSFPERSERLGETLQILTSMLTGEPTTFTGKHYQLQNLPNLPTPAQRPPIFVGGAGEKRTLPLVARYADVWNIPTYALGELDHKLSVLYAECEKIGRDPASIRLSLEGTLVIAPDSASLEAAMPKALRRFGHEAFGLEAGGFVGTPPVILDRIGYLMDRGFSHFVFITHDRGTEESLSLFADEVLAKLR
jgi:alkanesulfonate monooxygenase SsuD/methylene tetrahydromethanopterin reductase-like flavin-dependent oxidoreductase (luciferase family)